MTHYEDLSECNFFGPGIAPKLKAVGWLTRDDPYQTGKVTEEFFLKLCQLLDNPWHPPIAWSGVEICDICQFTGGAGFIDYKGYKIRGWFHQCLFIPGNKILFISPESIAHYIDAHQYAPPAEFCEAVLACPEMRSMGYLKELLANGGRELLAAISSLAPEK
jgi:hypothetical protein